MSRRQTKQTVRYGRGSYKPAPGGRGFDCAIFHRGRQLRARRPDADSARAWIDAQEESERLNRQPLTRLQLLDASDACAELPPGVTLLQAVRAALPLLTLPPSKTIREAAAEFLSNRAHGVKPVSLDKYRQALAQLAALVGHDRTVAEVTPADVERLLGTRSGRTRNNYLRHVATFFRWAVASRYARESPAANIRRARVAEPPKGILTVDQCRALLAAAAATEPRMAPYVAVLLFAGIRPGESERLTVERIGERYIRLDGAITKTADARHVPVSSALSAWLKAYPPAGPRLAPFSTKRLYEALRALRGWTCILAQLESHPAYAIREWPDDCTRHSYATYEYERTKDAAATAANLGHTGTDIFFKHYRALANPGDGARFAKITPKSVVRITDLMQRKSQELAAQRSPTPS